VAQSRVSVVATVLNERESVERLLRSLAEQTRRPDEVVICDGGSSDGTPQRMRALAAELAERLPQVRVLVEPGANISRGRNVAISAAAGPIIAVTDAGVRLSPRWLEELTLPWARANDRPLAVAGAFLPDVDGPFQMAMAATVLPLRDEIDPATFLPSSRSVAFTRQAWEQAGRYPEWLDYCEDLLFDFGINDLRSRRSSGFDWAPEAVVHFRPRTSLGAFWTQYYRYARGDGKADLWRRRHLVRYATYLIALPALVGHALWGFAARWLGWVGLIAGVALYLKRPVQRLVGLQRAGAGLTSGEMVRAAALIPVIRVTGDLAKMAGYPVGLLWRLRNRRRAEVHWRARLNNGERYGR
jgi:glycosyltransferase involved in cell wall biosynthesis